MSSKFFEQTDTLIIELTPDGEVITHDLKNDIEWCSNYTNDDEDLAKRFKISFKKLKLMQRGWIEKNGANKNQPDRDNSDRGSNDRISESE